VLPLADGADATVGRGTLVRFLNAGLSTPAAPGYLVPFDRLPLR